MGKKIEAKIIADSICPIGHRLTTFVLTFPRFILAELNTHRVFSKNSASSRAIPFEKMVKMVEEDPFIPIAWQKDHKGMQGTQYFTDLYEIGDLKLNWLYAKDKAVYAAKALNNGGVTKQLCNRLLEPFMWHTVILTATEFDNFFELRCPKYYDGKIEHKSIKDYLKSNGTDITKYPQEYWKTVNGGQSEIHMMQLAECMWDARNESVPKSLKEGDWHIPFGDRIDISRLVNTQIDGVDLVSDAEYNINKQKATEEAMLKIATARCARVSYLNFEGKDDYEADIKLYDSLLTSGHYSPFEHCARVMTTEEYVSYCKGIHSTSTDLIDDQAGLRQDSVIIDDYVVNREEQYGWCNNFRGFIQLRNLI